MRVSLVLTVVLALCLQGCAAANKQAARPAQHQQARQEDEEFYPSRRQTAMAQTYRVAPVAAKPKASETDAVNMTPKNIQATLKNAGFYSGAIDGKIGKKTKTAIKNFQKANGLTVDGVVGKQTWAKLKKYI